MVMYNNDTKKQNNIGIIEYFRTYTKSSIEKSRSITVSFTPNSIEKNGYNIYTFTSTELDLCASKRTNVISRRC